MLNEHEDEHHLLQRAKYIASHLNLHDRLIPHVAEHLHHLARGRSPIIWIQGQNCTGCSVTLMDSEHFDPTDLYHGKLSLRYQPDLMAAAGYQAIDDLEETEAEEVGRYILVVEGAIPTGEGERFCTFGLANTTKQLMGNTVPEDRTIYAWLEELTPGAAAVIAVGNCASFGGIPSENAGITGATSVPEVIAEMDSDKPVINVAGCPPHPDWLMGTLVDVMLWVTGEKEAPELNEHGCLEIFYHQLIHDGCERKASFEKKRFLLDWNDAEEPENKCLIRLGCKGMKTHGDCPSRRWSENVNWCVGANAPCQGCTEPGFLKRLPRSPK